MSIPRHPDVPGKLGQIRSEIHLADAYINGLKGLEEFSPILVIFYMERAAFVSSAHLLRRPRAQANQPEIGVFAQRTKYRPNPIGMTAVKLLAIINNVHAVQALDALDGTPVLDLKPYLPVFDKVEDTKLLVLIAEFEKGYF